MKNGLICRRPASKNPRTRERRNKLRQALRSYQLQSSPQERSSTRLVRLDSDDPALDELRVVRFVGAVGRGNRTEVLVEARQDPEPAETSDQLDTLCKQESMAAGLISHRESKEGDGPLRRFLRSLVGRPWQEVESELQRMLAGCSRSTYLIVERLQKLISRSVERLADGQLNNPARPGYLQSTRRGDHFYVDPDSDTLQELPRPRRKKEEAAGPRFRQVIVSKLERLVEMDGIWYRVDFKPIPTMDSLRRACKFQPLLSGENAEPSKPTGPLDVVLGNEAVDDPDNYSRYGSSVSNWKLAPFLQEWGTKIYAVRKEQANSDDLRKHGINGTKPDCHHDRASQPVLRQRHRQPPSVSRRPD